MLDESVDAIQCRECDSLSVSRDGIHWSLVIESNDKREEESEGLQR